MTKSNKQLDKLDIKNLVNKFLDKEEKTILALKKEKGNITRAIEAIRKNKIKGGRIIYIGAGTSGRLGVLDAVECSPTFSTNIFHGLIAGGKNAMFKSKEGAEDSEILATSDLMKIKLSNRDTVIGIAASGETPYTISAIKFAKKKHCLTISISSKPKSTLSKTAKINIVVDLGDEIILGSSRLSSGTAQKIVLNMLSSIAMIKSGKVYDNLMIDVQPTNKKLIKRAIGIISTICEVPVYEAEDLFNRANKNTKAAIVMYYKKCDLKKAQSLLSKKDDVLRNVIG